MNIYLDSGYIDIAKILDTKLPFIFVVGGRGTGKTYTALKTLVERNIKFIYMRRTQTQTDLINKPELNPFKSLNTDLGWDIGTAPISKYNAGIYHREEGKCTGMPIGYTCALSTVSNIRGFDASDVKILLYDEFIAEKHERPLKNEATALLNAYETVNRNRELKGQDPLQLVCLANANDLANPIFAELRLVNKAQKMTEKGQEVYINRESGIGIFLLSKSEISISKSQSALYRLTKNTEFEKMAIQNKFSHDTIGNIKARNLAEYKPIATIGELTLYKHKSDNRYYASMHCNGGCLQYGTSSTELARMKKVLYWLWDAYIENCFEFESYMCEVLLTKAFA